jgi:hypothetical protein
MPPVKAVPPNTRGNPNWTKGVSGNPGGRPRAVVEVAELARLETTASIRALVRVRDSEASPPAAVVAAATTLLDRAWGRPQQSITTPDGSNALLLHWAAATAVSAELQQEFQRRGRPATITGIAESASVQADGKIVDLLAQPLPEE